MEVLGLLSYKVNAFSLCLVAENVDGNMNKLKMIEQNMVNVVSVS